MAQEKHFENKVKMFLMEHGSWFLKYWGGGHFTKTGVPDLLVCDNGQFMGIELKAEKGEPTLLQLKMLESIRKSNGWAVLLYPGDFEEFKQWYVHKMQMKEWYLANIKLQEEWIEKLLERGIEDGKEEGNN